MPLHSAFRIRLWYSDQSFVTSAATRVDLVAADVRSLDHRDGRRRVSLVTSAATDSFGGCSGFHISVAVCLRPSAWPMQFARATPGCFNENHENFHRTERHIPCS